MPETHMTELQLVVVAALFAFAVVAGWLIGVMGCADRAADSVARDRYRRAALDLDRWCGHESPHARLIAAHLIAHGEGHAKNAGTPSGDEVCTINGLREQLRRLDATRSNHA